MIEVSRSRKLEVETFDFSSQASLAEITHSHTQRNIFQKTFLKIYRRSEQKKDLLHLLQEIFLLKVLPSSFVFLYESPLLKADLKKIIGKNNIVFLPCYDPYESEIPLYIKDLAKNYKLDLQSSDARVIQQYVGNDLQKIDNEIAKITLLKQSHQSEGSNLLANI